MEIDELLDRAPKNTNIRQAMIRCAEIVDAHKHIMCSVSGGADSDVMLDMLLRCGAKDKTDFYFFNTGIEWRATLEHLDELEQKYGITIRRESPVKPVALAVKEYGVPFWSKFVSNQIDLLQKSGFRFDDTESGKGESDDFSKGSMKWWRNISPANGDVTRYTINYHPYLKEFMSEHPPSFRISDKCCTYAKKDTAKRIMNTGVYDLSCIGLRQAEGGVRTMRFHNCFTENAYGILDSFRPLWYLKKADMEEYCSHYGVTHSRCYTEYGLKRTGCVGCPFSKEFEDDLAAMQQFEPQLYRAANAIFGESYEYTRQYLEFRSGKMLLDKHERWKTHRERHIDDEEDDGSIGMPFDIDGEYNDTYEPLRTEDGACSIHSNPRVLEDRRLELGMTQADVARNANILLRMYQRFESGERNISTASMRVGLAVCKALALDPMRFLPKRE